jgi:hypothetical protein
MGSGGEPFGRLRPKHTAGRWAVDGAALLSVPLPPEDAVLAACAGTRVPAHPVLQAAYELARLHEAKLAATAEETHEIDRARAELVHIIDCWVSAHMPPPQGAAYLHTETGGMVIDRIAQFSTDAHTALNHGAPEPQLHCLWQRLAELALGYSDLAFEIHIGTRKVPDLACYATPADATRQDRKDQ